MPDITKCSGLNCSERHECYRFTSRIDPVYQSYFSTPPIRDGKCDQKMIVINLKKKKRKK